MKKFINLLVIIGIVIFGIFMTTFFLNNAKKELPLDDTINIENLSFEKNDEGLTLIKINNDVKNIVIDDTYSGYKVTKIKEDCFKNAVNLESIVLPRYLKQIDIKMFSNCPNLSFNKYLGANYLGCLDNPYFVLMSLVDLNLKSYTIHEDCLMLADFCFKDNLDIEQIIIPKNVKNISKKINPGFSKLKSIIVSKENNMYDSRHESNTLMDTLTNELILGCSNSVISSNVKKLNDFAFYKNEELINITIPDSVKIIGESCFEGCLNLEKVILPTNIENIGVFAFKDTKKLQTKEYSSLKYLGTLDNPFYLCLGKINPNDNLTNIVFQNNTKVITGGAFKDDYCIKNVTLPNNLEVIAIEAFSGCKNLEICNLNQKLEIIGQKSFKDCSSLLRIDIPKTTYKIENLAFLNTTNVKNITVSTNNNYFDSRDASNNIIDSKTNTILFGCINSTFPESIRKIGDFAFANIPFKELTITKGIVEIGKGAFLNTNQLTNIIMPSTLEIIGELCFKDCINLTKISLDENLKLISIGAFLNCANLKEINYSSSRMRFEKIKIDKDNEDFLSANIIYK